jgi:hypothetical protein
MTVFLWVYSSISDILGGEVYIVTRVTTPCSQGVLNVSEDLLFPPLGEGMDAARCPKTSETAYD